MRSLLPFLLAHGYAVVFATVLAEQAGAPIPAVPVLLGVGALAGMGRLPLAPAILLAVVAAVLSDSFWYWLGRRRGVSILRLLCAISLEPDSCVSNTRRTFSRLGAWALVFAKFVPGLSTAAPPMAGVNAMPFWRFAVSDGAGSALWAGAFLGLGYAFHQQIENVTEMVTAYGARAGLVVSVVLIAWVAFKLWQRERFLQKLRIARITPEELRILLDAGETIAILDLRHEEELISTARRLPRAVWYDRATLPSRHMEIPRDRDVILYCS